MTLPYADTIQVFNRGDDDLTEYRLSTSHVKGIGRSLGKTACGASNVNELTIIRPNGPVSCQHCIGAINRRRLNGSTKKAKEGLPGMFGINGRRG